jgi:hypothetical protein
MRKIPRERRTSLIEAGTYLSGRWPPLGGEEYRDAVRMRMRISDSHSSIVDSFVADFDGA